MNFNSWRLRQKLIAIIGSSLIVQLLISYQLWINIDRHYPLIPTFQGVEFQFQDTLGVVFFSILLLSLASMILGKSNSFINGLFFALLILFILNDINRLQVWVYELGVMLAILCFIGKENKDLAIKALQLIVVSVYCWSGLQKLNIYFIEGNFPWLFEPFGLDAFFLDFSGFAYFAANLEFLIGLGLFFKRSRKIALPFAIGMHLILLICLGPFGHNWNHVVWPWNVAMIALLYLLFNEQSKPIFSTHKEFKRHWLLPSIFLFFGIFPVLNFFNAWDEQLSFKMYSGISPEGIFYYKQNQTVCIPNKIKKNFVHTNPSKKLNQIILDDWAFHELNVVPYKSKKRIMQVGEKLCRCVENPELAGIKLLMVYRWNKNEDLLLNYTCAELLK